ALRWCSTGRCRDETRLHPSAREPVIQFAAFVAYICAFVLWLWQLLRGAGGARGRAASALTILAVGLHGFALAQFWQTYGELPLVGPGAALSSLAFVGGLALVVMLPMREVGRIALALLPFVVVVQGVALAVGIRLSPAA